MPGEKDLFDESSMSFGEHLESLRTHLIRAMFGLAIGVGIALFYGNDIIKYMSRPITAALAKYDKTVTDDMSKEETWNDKWNSFKEFFTGKTNDETEPKEEPHQVDAPSNSIEVMVSPRALAKSLHEAFPKTYDPPPDKIDPLKEEKLVPLTMTSGYFKRWTKVEQEGNKPKTFGVQEAFLTYLKVGFVSGFILASPWVFFQLWLFVAAGLYPHERKYVYLYMPVSIGLFLLGAFFCFQWVFPIVLDFLLRFNFFMETQATIRLSEYISFAIMLPVMFGLSFQLPLVMLLLERINIITVKTYREKRRMAILVISVISMLMTPADPMSMMMMMIPLCLLYELGIWMCQFAGPKTNPFDQIAAT